MGDLLSFSARRIPSRDRIRLMKLKYAMDRFYKKHPERVEYQRKLAREARDEDTRNGVPPPDFKEILRLMKLARNPPPINPS